MLKKFMLGVSFLISVILLLFFSGYVFISHPEVQVEPLQIYDVVISDFSNQHWEYEILTNDYNEINRLILDLQSVWVTNLKSRPKETGFIINFDENGSRNGFDWSLIYYPKADVIEFSTGRDINRPIISINSSRVLKELYQRFQLSKNP